MDDFTSFNDILPDGAIPAYAIRIVVYLDPEDQVLYDHYDITGDATLRDWVGTIEAVKFRMCCNQFDVVRENDD